MAAASEQRAQEKPPGATSCPTLLSKGQLVLNRRGILMSAVSPLKAIALTFERQPREATLTAITHANAAWRRLPRAF